MTSFKHSILTPQTYNYPKSYILQNSKPKPKVQNPKPKTLNPKPY